MRTIVLIAAGAALGIGAYQVQVHDLHSPRDHAAAIVIVGWLFLFAGLVAWARRRENRLGPLMVATAFALLARQLRYSHNPVLFTLFFAVGDLGYALIGHTVFAYPFGRIRGRAERALVIAGYTTVLVLPLAVLLFHAAREPMLYYNPFDPEPHRSLIDVAQNAHAVEVLQKTQVAIFFGVLATLFIVVIIRNLVRATPRMRRVLLPLVVAAIAIAFRAVFEFAFTFFVDERAFALNTLFWWQIVAAAALPIALLVGLLRARLARAAVGDLVVELQRTPADGIEGALARAVGDPTLQLAYWLPERRQFVDGDGQVVSLPPTDVRRGVTEIEHDGEPLAVLIHDRSLLEEPELVRAAGAAATFAIQNARLQAELRVQLEKVQESRARVVAASDDERRRIERDLHDGAQQRLVAIGLELRTAQRAMGGQLDPEVEQLLTTTVDGLGAAVEELRELAHGIHPTILSEGGLGPALNALAGRSALPVSVDVTSERFAPDLEATAYFVACEALANVVKHADADAAAVTVRGGNGSLVVEVADDGVGGASLARGTGLSGLADRVEARGGSLRVFSPPGEGTRVVGEIPCGS